jgi:alkylated DNA repair dioxygenase AlkB
MQYPSFRKAERVSARHSLPTDKSNAPEGFLYVADFISPELEQVLISEIAKLPLQPFQFGQYEGKRRVVSFGNSYDYTEHRLRDADPIPLWLSPLVERVETFGGIGTQIGQVLCTEYDVGVGIGWHRDRPQYDRVFGISLGSPCRFRFRRRTGEKWQRFTLNAEPRSIYQLAGDARQGWEHSILAVEEPRYSITFRTMR